MSSSYCVGIDVGGTNTDAAVICTRTGRVVGWAKALTTPDDVTVGIKEVLGKVIAKDASSSSEISADQVCRVSLGTTHFLNAVIQRRGLARVSVIRLCGRATRAIPPFFDISNDLREAIEGDSFLVDGGYYLNGKEFEALNVKELEGVADKIKKSAVRNIVVSGMNSVLNPDQEDFVFRTLRRLVPDASVTISHEIGHMGLLARENAAILNECLKPLCRKVLSGLQNAIAEAGLGHCRLYFTQNDGTLASISRCLSFPVCTFASGQTNSMRGAAHLSSAAGDGETAVLAKNAIVVDIGGTSTDVGQLVNGFPREAGSKVEIGGVYTNFRMPDLYSIGLGGGSLVKRKADHNGFSVGPLSVGNRLLSECQSLGGKTLTATDVVIKAEIYNGLKDADTSKIGLSDKEAEWVLESMKEMVEAAVDCIKTSSDDVPLIVVGGGGILLDRSKSLAGVSQLLFPDNYQVANAVGAALAQVSGEFNQVMLDVPEAQALAKAKNAAVEAAFKNGASRDSIEIVEVNQMPMPYLAGAVQYNVKAVGDLDPNSVVVESTDSFRGGDDTANFVRKLSTGSNKKVAVIQPEFTKLPYNNGTSDIWELDAYDVEALALGAGLLGCGGGGSPYLGLLRARHYLAKGLKLTVIKPEAVKPGPVVSLALMGAPTAVLEKLVSGNEMPTALATLEKVIGTKASAVTSFEIGGINSIEPLVTAAKIGLPVVDGDGMGRAFPELDQYLPAIMGHHPCPAVIADEKGTALASLHADSAKHLEHIFRAHCDHIMGCSAAIAMSGIPAEELSTKLVCGSYTRAWEVGHSVLSAVKEKRSPVEGLIRDVKGSKCLLWSGKVTNVSRRTVGGFARGTFNLVSFDSDQQEFEVEFQNENLIATAKGASGGEDKVLATVPHLIIIMETESGLMVQTEDLRYGLRVSMVVVPAPDELLTPQALKVVGPAAFGYKDIKKVVI